MSDIKFPILDDGNVISLEYYIKELPLHPKKTIVEKLLTVFNKNIEDSWAGFRVWQETLNISGQYINKGELVNYWNLYIENNEDPNSQKWLEFIKNEIPKNHKKKESNAHESNDDFLNDAIKSIESIWLEEGKEIIELSDGVTIWHSGVIDFNNLELKIDRVIWFTKDSAKQDYYNNWARQDAEHNNCQAYKSELVSSSNLKLANFNKKHFHEISNGNHYKLNMALNSFCEKNKIDGLIRGDDLNEIALIATKLSSLKILKITDLSKERNS